jgi:uncharacterized protein (TIGR03032 family)
VKRAWAAHDAEWRDPAQIASHWKEADQTDPRLLGFSTRGDWWGTLAKCGMTLLVTREYEHLLMAMRVSRGRPHVTFMRMPHPSGLAVDRRRGRVYVACTRNPNQIFELAPASGLMRRTDRRMGRLEGRPLMPVRSWFYPGSLYLHELAMIGGTLHANAVGRNTVVRLEPDGDFRDVWWPRAAEKRGLPATDRNLLQLNSIAAGKDLRSSYFTASSEKPAGRFPGNPNYPVDRRGVIFSGRTRGPIARGLTRPHSARLHRGRIWADNSGYGEVGFAEDEKFCAVARLPGWTRGLCFSGNVAFVGTSRVLPRFRNYAPGLDIGRSICGVHALDAKSGRILGSILWPRGNQIFAIEWAPSDFTSGFAFAVPGGASERQKSLFYGFKTALTRSAR